MQIPHHHIFGFSSLLSNAHNMTLKPQENSEKEDLKSFPVKKFALSSLKTSKNTLKLVKNKTGARKIQFICCSHEPWSLFSHFFLKKSIKNPQISFKQSKFGTTESQKTIFDEALKYCDEKKVLLQQARILETQAETNFKTGGKASISNDKKSKEQSIKESSTENIYQKQLNSKKVSETFKGADEMYGKCLKKFPNDMQCLKKYFSFLIEKVLISIFFFLKIF